MLRAWAGILRRSSGHGPEVGRLLHTGAETASAHRDLKALIVELLAEAVVKRSARNDASPEELAAFCLFALSGAAALCSEAAVDRLVAMVLDGVRVPR